MGSKTISLDDDAYARLSGAKRPGESFSDVVKRMTGPKEHPLLKLRGLLTPKDAEDVRRVIREMREADAAEWEKKLARWKR
jgi:predicted CopG family antitoxin